MAINDSVLGQFAFKQLNNKSFTNDGLGIGNEAQGFSLNSDASNIWLSTPRTTADNFILFVNATLRLDGTSNGKAYFAEWPTTAPTGTDLLTGKAYTYGLGVLKNISAGNRVIGCIPPSYNIAFEAKPFNNLTSIPVNDNRDWIFQYSSGIFYQNNIIASTPTTIQVYVYVGELLSNIQKNNIYYNFVASGTNSYTSNTTPTLATYSTNHVYIGKFTNSNTNSSVTLNLNGLGTSSVFKKSIIDNSNITLLPNDIIGTAQNINAPNYYFVRENSNFIVYDYNPVSNLFKYSNTNYTTLGDTTAIFNNVSQDDVNTALLTTDRLSFVKNIAINTSVNKELGESLNLGTYSLTWQTNNISLSDGNIEIYDNNVGLLGYVTNSNTYNLYNSVTVSNATITDKKYYLTVNNKNGIMCINDFSVNWDIPTYYGSSTYSLIDNIIFNTFDKSFDDKNIINGLNITSTMSSYKYIVVDDRYKIDTLLLFNMPLDVETTGSYTYSFSGINYDRVDLQNTFGITSSYNVYRTKNKIYDSIKIEYKKSEV